MDVLPSNLCVTHKFTLHDPLKIAPYVTHHIKTGQLSVECISIYYTICMGKNKGNKKKLRLIFDHKIAMLHQIYT